MTARGVPSEFTVKILKDLGLRPILFALAVWDVLGGDARTRKTGSNFWDFPPQSDEYEKGRLSAVKKLAHRYETQSETELAQLGEKVDEAARIGADWLPVALGVDRQARVSGCATASGCPSKFLGTSRQMVSYWRHHREFSEALRCVRDLIKYARENEIKP